MPMALDRKYRSASASWPWQFLFPAGHYASLPGSSSLRRHHLHPSVIQRAVKSAVLRSAIEKRATCFSGSAGPLATAADYARFLQMLLNGGELDGQRILGRKSVELMTVDHLGGVTFADGEGLD